MYFLGSDTYGVEQSVAPGGGAFAAPGSGPRPYLPGEVVPQLWVPPRPSQPKPSKPGYQSDDYAKRLVISEQKARVQAAQAAQEVYVAQAEMKRRAAESLALAKARQKEMDRLQRARLVESVRGRSSLPWKYHKTEDTSKSSAARTKLPIQVVPLYSGADPYTVFQEKSRKAKLAKAKYVKSQQERKDFEKEHGTVDRKILGAGIILVGLMLGTKTK